MKRWYKIFLALIVLFALINIPTIGPLINKDLNNPVVEEIHRVSVSRWYSILDCGGREFISFGLMSNGQKCSTDQDWKDFWPAGPSFEIRDKRGACCTIVGECGQFSDTLPEALK